MLPFPRVMSLHSELYEEVLHPSTEAVTQLTSAEKNQCNHSFFKCNFSTFNSTVKYPAIITIILYFIYKVMMVKMVITLFQSPASSNTFTVHSKRMVMYLP